LLMRRQRRWKDHAASVESLARKAFATLAGPWGAGEKRFLLIFHADSEEAVEARLADNPWTRIKVL